jgi:hypothetical protein
VSDGFMTPHFFFYTRFRNHHANIVTYSAKVFFGFYWVGRFGWSYKLAGRRPPHFILLSSMGLSDLPFWRAEKEVQDYNIRIRPASHYYK